MLVIRSKDSVFICNHSVQAVDAEEGEEHQCGESGGSSVGMVETLELFFRPF